LKEKPKKEIVFKIKEAYSHVEAYEHKTTALAGVSFLLSKEN
jgi:hypothetical protein